MNSERINYLLDQLTVSKTKIPDFYYNIDLHGLIKNTVFKDGVLLQFQLAGMYDIGEYVQLYHFPQGPGSEFYLVLRTYIGSCEGCQSGHYSLDDEDVISLYELFSYNVLRSTSFDTLEEAKEYYDLSITQLNN